ncbi:MAG: hypothetical protein U0941_11360 [Planctomycetaceae bacterium]
MDGITLHIDGAQESFGRAWVHIQPVRSSVVAEYRIRIPKELVGSVFAGAIKTNDISWNEYLTDETREFGSVMLSAYLEKISDILGSAPEKFRWVIASLDAAIEIAEGLEVRGKAIPFDSSRFFR